MPPAIGESLNQYSTGLPDRGKEGRKVGVARNASLLSIGAGKTRGTTKTAAGSKKDRDKRRKNQKDGGRWKRGHLP